MIIIFQIYFNSVSTSLINFQTFKILQIIIGPLLQQLQNASHMLCVHIYYIQKLHKLAHEVKGLFVSQKTHGRMAIKWSIIGLLKRESVKFN